jgi:hypothetical protein
MVQHAAADLRVQLISVTVFRTALLRKTMDELKQETSDFSGGVVPMAATLRQERFTAPEWIFERKLDGI